MSTQQPKEEKKYVQSQESYIEELILTLRFKNDRNARDEAIEKILGSKSRVSEILNKQRKLNLRMIRNIHSALNIPYEILAEDYKIVGQS